MLRGVGKIGKTGQNIAVNILITCMNCLLGIAYTFSIYIHLSARVVEPNMDLKESVEPESRYRWRRHKKTIVISIAYGSKRQEYRKM